MIKQGINAPFIEKYEKVLANNAHSRVFAPLAECYRKVGMIDKALDILKLGLRHHPDYVLGLLSLSYCHVDNGYFEQAYDILAPLVSENRENLKLQKTFASICVEIGEDAEALDTYKFLLFMNPKDTEVATKVEQLEQNIYRDYHSIGPDGDSSTSLNLFNTKMISTNPSPQTHLFDEEGLDDWCELDLFNSNNDVDSASEPWEMVRGAVEINDDENEKRDDDFDNSERDFNLKLDSSSLESDDTEELSSVNNEDNLDDEGPFVTHTLVDLYCSQGHFEKAINLLKQIIKLNPDDTKSADKLREVLSFTNLSESDEDEGHEHLMEIVDQTIEGADLDHIIEKEKPCQEFKANTLYLENVEKKLNLFHQLICDKAFRVKNKTLIF